MENSTNNPFSQVKKELDVEGTKYNYFSLPALNDDRIKTLPYSIRVLLESALRNCDEFNVKSKRYLYKIFRGRQ